MCTPRACVSRVGVGWGGGKGDERVGGEGIQVRWSVLKNLEPIPCSSIAALLAQAGRSMAIPSLPISITSWPEAGKGSAGAGSGLVMSCLSNFQPPLGLEGMTMLPVGTKGILSGGVLRTGTDGGIELEMESCKKSEEEREAGSERDGWIDR